ncbi:MAG: sigma-70 family RNA polymerase sigma factor [Planctomycetes bacterium]|nr:sigma-70 family RNA polymerase sigma factor [Planctomycetota bacterium]
MHDAAEFEAILRETQSVVRAYIAGMGVSLDTVDDLAQEVYLEFHRGRDLRPADVEPVRWLKGIAKNLCLNHFRRSKRKAEQQLAAVAELLEPVPCRREEASEKDALDACLGKLPGRSRQMIALRYEEGLESSAIGRRFDLSAEAVRITLLRIRTALRDCLERRLAQEGTP